MISARNVAKVIDPAKFHVLYGYIDQHGLWWQVDSVTHISGDDARQILPILGTKVFAVYGTKEVICPDVILPILHGRHGEDGSVQALAQLMHLPIVGCDMTASAAAMNKYITKEIAMANDIVIAPFMVHRRADKVPDYASVASALGDQLFVKPASAGSSVGVSKVSNQQQLEAALIGAHVHDDMVLVERAIVGRELEVAVLGNYPDVQVSVVGEIRAQGEFYSYESKYDETSTSQVIIPADIAPEVSDQLREQAVMIFYALGCSGMARVDFFVENDTQQIYLNEVNTIPGFTDISMYPKLWNHAGMSYGQLVERLIELALSKTTV